MNAIIQRAKSKTYWFALAVAILPYTDQLIGVVSGVNPLAGALISAGIAILREITKEPLADK